jgi:hypothetical protein
VQEGSKQYVELYCQAAPSRDDVYANNPLLPQGILLGLNPPGLVGCGSAGCVTDACPGLPSCLAGGRQAGRCLTCMAILAKEG